MPVTAKLSRKFYEKLGDDVANELVEWFNLVDATYRSDLRELNELNFARFDAELGNSAWLARCEDRAPRARTRSRCPEGSPRRHAALDKRLAELETRLTEPCSVFGSAGREDGGVVLRRW